jgi:hypothetical protein
MKSIFSEFQLRRKLLEAIGWEMVGQGMWRKKLEIPPPDERVDEDEVLEIEKSRFERIQEVFESLNAICNLGSDYQKVEIEYPKSALDQLGESTIENPSGICSTCGSPGIKGPTGMVDEPGPQGAPEDEDTNEKIARCFELLHYLDFGVTKSMKNMNARLESLELSSTAWRGVNGRLTIVESQIKKILNVFDGLRTSYDETAKQSAKTEIR